MLVTDIALTIMFFWLISFLALKFTNTFDPFLFMFCGCTSTVLFACAFVFSRFLADTFIIC